MYINIAKMQWHLGIIALYIFLAFTIRYYKSIYSCMDICLGI